MASARRLHCLKAEMSWHSKSSGAAGEIVHRGRFCLLSSARGLPPFLLVLALSFTPLRCAAACPAANSAQTTVELEAADQQTFREALSAMRAGDSAKAETTFKTLHTRYPADFEVNEAFGLFYASQSRPADAVPLLLQAANDCPQAGIAHANLGIAYLKLQNGDKAAKELARADELQPGNPHTEEALGEAQMLLKHWSQAGAAFSAALTSDPANQDLLYNCALACFNSGQYPKAERLLGRMAGIGSSASAQSLFGDVEEKLGDYKQAAQHYLEAARLDPSEENAYVLGVEFLRHWTFAPAIQEFSTGVQRFPDSHRMQLGLAIAYYGNENYDSAIQLMVKLLSGDPNNAMYAELLGRACVAPPEGVNPACAVLTQFSQHHPQDAAVAAYAATSLLHKPSAERDLDTAAKLLQSALLADPRLPQAQFEMGVLLQTESKWKESIAPLEAAIRLKPDYAVAHYRLARAYSRQGQTEKAKNQIDLYQAYNKKNEADLDARMKEITTLVMKIQ
jgi:tetratricopeptide (TPR) repeat protein